MALSPCLNGLQQTDVAIMLKGDKGQARSLLGYEGKHFREGQTDTFVLQLKDVGALTSLQLKVTGATPTKKFLWRPVEVIVTDTTNGTSYSFPVEGTIDHRPWLVLVWSFWSVLSSFICQQKF